MHAGVRRFRRRWPLGPLCSAEAFEVVGASPSGVEELRPRRAGGESGEQEDARRVKGHALRRHTRARARRYVHTRRRERRRRRGCTSRAHGTRAAEPKRLLLVLGRNCIGADEPAGTERLFLRRQAQTALRRRLAHAHSRIRLPRRPAFAPPLRRWPLSPRSRRRHPPRRRSDGRQRFLAVARPRASASPASPPPRVPRPHSRTTSSAAVSRGSSPPSRARRRPPRTHRPTPSPS